MEVVFNTSEGTEQERICASTVAVGYPTTVAQLAGRKFGKFGKLCYAAAAAAVCPTPFRARLACNGQQQSARHLTGLVAKNTRHMANFVAFPEASLEDGYFDVMELDAGFLKQSIHNVSAFSRLHFYTPATPIRTKTAEVLLDQPRELLLDGEIYSDVISVRIRILPAALTCNRADRKNDSPHPSFFRCRRSQWAGSGCIWPLAMLSRRRAASGGSNSLHTSASFT